MKKLFLFLVITTLISIGKLYAQWIPLGPTGFDVSDAPNISMVLDSTDIPYIAYKDPDSASSKLTVQRFNGNKWITIGARGFTPTQVNNSRIAMGTRNLPYVAYSNDGIGGNPGTNKTNVMKYNGTAWVAVGAADFSINSADVLAFVVDHLGTPYVACLSYSPSSISIYKFNGSNWVDAGTQAAIAAPGVNSALALAVDATNTPYFAYADTSGKASVLKLSGGAWTAVGPLDFTIGSADWFSLVIGHDNIPYLAFADGNNAGRISIMGCDSGTWAYVGTTTGIANTEQSGYISLTNDFCDGLYVGCQDSIGAAVYKSIGGSYWHVLGSEGFTPDYASYASLAVGQNGNVYFAYDPVSANTYAPVVGYLGSQVICTGITELEGLATLQLYPNPAIQSASLSFNLAKDSRLSISVTDIAGETKAILTDNEWLAEGNHLIAIDTKSLSAGIYFCRIQSASESKVSRLVVIK